MESYQLDAIRGLARARIIQKGELASLLADNFCHPDYKDEYIKSVIGNLTSVTIDYLNALTKRKRISFMKALGAAVQVAFEIDIWRFHLGKKDGETYWRGSPTFFGALTSLTYPLETIRTQLAKTSQRSFLGSVILVEGESEMEFLKIIREVIGLGEPNYMIYNFRGKGEIRNLVHLIKEKHRQGFRVLLTYDSDGERKEILEKRLKGVSHLISSRFSFRSDFEDSFPPRFLNFALQQYRLKYLRKHDSISVEELRQSLRNPKFLNININKPRLARILGYQMKNLLTQYWKRVFSRSRNRFKSEVFDFLRFLVRNC